MRKTVRNVFLFSSIAALLLIIAVCSMIFGSVKLPFSRIVAAFSGDDSSASVILFGLRLPRLLASMLAGVGLAIAGIMLQTVTDNELCAPNIIGVNSGAGFFVMLSLCLFPAMWQLLPLTAFLGAMAISFAVLLIAKLGGVCRQKTTLVLAGVALSSLMNAGISFLSLKYPDVLSSYTSFSVGGFYGMQMSQLIIPSVIIAVLSSAALLAAPKIHLLCLGDEAAASLGVNVRLIRIAAVIIASGLCAAVVSFAGLLGFVGLIVPHIAKRISHGGLRVQICISGLFGAAIVSLSDLIGRTVFAPWELPAGIIMALVSVPFFLYLIVRRKTNDKL